MGLALNDAMRERLRQVRKSQLLNLRDWPGAESILLGLEVICVRLGFGNASFVGIDGRFLFLD